MPLSWDRVPYITTLGSGKPSILPAWRHIRRNVIVSNYASQEAIDNDDGSAFYKTYENFFVFGANGIKSDFNGRKNEHYRNVYGYVSDCWGPSGTWLKTGDDNVFADNWCIANSDDGGFASDCHKPEGFNVSGNKVYNRDGHFASGFKLCDTSNTVALVPPDGVVVAMGMAIVNGQEPVPPGKQAAPMVEAA